MQNIGGTRDTLRGQVPSHPMQQKRLLELKAPNWKELAFIYGSCIANKENGSQSIGAGSATLSPTKSPQQILDGQA